MLVEFHVQPWPTANCRWKRGLHSVAAGIEIQCGFNNDVGFEADNELVYSFVTFMDCGVLC